MAISPSTDLRIIKCPLEIDEKNQITFATRTAQTNYFLSLPHIEIEDITYQRKDSTIRFPAHIDSIIEYNYCMYKNENYSDKWFYAFITNMEYKNDDMTLVTIKTDVYQTWAFDLEWKKSFIEREMLSVADDIIGANILDENLDIGEPIVYDQMQTDFNQQVYFVIESSFDPFNNEVGAPAKILNNSLYANHIFLFPVDLTNPTSLDSVKYIHSVENFFWALLVRGKTYEEVQNIYVLPQVTFPDVEYYSTNIQDGYNDPVTIWYGIPDASFDISKQAKNISKLNSFAGLTIKNKKCFCYPFNYLFVSNNNGNNNIYKYEKFLNSNYATFDLYFSNQIGGSGRLIPYDYNCKLAVESVQNIDESLPMGKFPTFNWSGDAFTNWLTANGVNVASSLVNIGANVFSASAGDFSGIPSTFNAISNEVSGFIKANMLPTIQGGNNTSDCLYAGFKNEFTFKRMRCDDQHMQCIDDFFSMFGYRTNKLKMPNLNNRKYWNYIKTIDCNILADIPQNDLDEIKNMFDNGITLWHTTSGFLNYSLDNTEAIS